MRCALGLLALLAAGISHAGEVGLYSCPTNDPDVTHYRIYADGVHVATNPVGTLVPSATLLSDCDGEGVANDQLLGRVLSGVADNCTPVTYTARWAIEESPGQWLESADSVSVTTQARPSVNFITAGSAGVRQIVGENFMPGVVVTKPDGTVISSTLQSCQVIDITDTATRSVVVTVPGLTPAQYTFPIEEPQDTRAF